MRTGETEAWMLYNSSPTQHTETLLKFYEPLIQKWTADAILKYRNALTADEYRSELVRGMSQAFTKFDPTLGVSFAVFGGYRAKNQILDHIREMDPLSRRQRVEGNLSICSMDAPDCGHFDDGTLDNFMSRIENEEIWSKVYTTISARQRKKPLWLALNAVYREGWNQRELAKFLRVSLSSISAWLKEAHRILRTARNIRWFVEGRHVKTNHKPDHLLKQKRRGARFTFPRKGMICCRLDCDKPCQTKGLCKVHYREKNPKPCSVFGCKELYHAKGFCLSHYQSNYLYGSPLVAIKKMVVGDATCACGKPSTLNGICKKCRERAYHKGEKYQAYYKNYLLTYVRPKLTPEQLEKQRERDRIRTTSPEYRAKRAAREKELLTPERQERRMARDKARSAIRSAKRDLLRCQKAIESNGQHEPPLCNAAGQILPTEWYGR